jgi:hypothetical protein
MNIRTASSYRDHRYSASSPAVSLRVRPVPHELAQAGDVALFVVDGSPPCLRVDPTGDPGLDESAQFGRVKRFGLPLCRAAGSGRGRGGW